MSGAVASMPSFTRSGRPSSSFRSSSPSGRTFTACRVSSCTAAMRLMTDGFQILDAHGLELVCGLEAEDLSEKRQLGGEGASQRFRLSESMSFALEREVRVRNPTLPKRVDDRFRLRRRNDLVVE